MDQISQVLRCVKIDEKEVKVEKSCLCFIEMKAKVLSKLQQQLTVDDVNTEDCRGQAFDNAALMAGIDVMFKRTSQKLIKRLYLCNHSLNLAAAVYTASVAADSVTFFGALDSLFSFLSASTYVWDILIEIAGATLKQAEDMGWRS